MRIDSSGNVGIGVTPESWHSGWNTLQIGDGASIAGRTASGNVDISSNAYRDSTNNRWEYIGTNGSEEAAKYTQFSGQHVFYTASSGTADNEISWSTAMTIDNSGNVATPGITLGNGTTYNAANHLDDYEEGTWTPVAAGSSTAGAYTYTIQVGKYTKIGNLVHVAFEIRIDSVTSAGTGRISVTGLPFSAMTGFNHGPSPFYHHGIDVGKDQAFVGIAGAVVSAISMDAAGTQDVTTMANVGTSDYLRAELTYQV